MSFIHVNAKCLLSCVGSGWNTVFTHKISVPRRSVFIQVDLKMTDGKQRCFHQLHQDFLLPGYRMYSYKSRKDISESVCSFCDDRADNSKGLRNHIRHRDVYLLDDRISWKQYGFIFKPSTVGPLSMSYCLWKKLIKCKYVRCTENMKTYSNKQTTTKALSECCRYQAITNDFLKNENSQKPSRIQNTCECLVCCVSPYEFWPESNGHLRSHSTCIWMCYSRNDIAHVSAFPLQS